VPITAESSSGDRYPVGTGLRPFLKQEPQSLKDKTLAAWHAQAAFRINDMHEFSEEPDTLSLWLHIRSRIRIVGGPLAAEAARKLLPWLVESMVNRGLWVVFSGTKPSSY
jgi:hypothetical protein